MTYIEAVRSICATFRCECANENST